MMDRMYDLSWEIAGDSIRLEQDAGCGESSVVDLHTCQLRLLAERAGLLPAASPIPVHLARRIKRLAIDIKYVADEIWLDEIVSRIADGLAYQIAMNNLLLDSEDLAEDLDACQTDDDDGQQRNGKESARERNENSPSISVTDSGETRKPGRPATGEAMSNAERQKAYRDRKAGSPPETLPLALEAPTHADH